MIKFAIIFQNLLNQSVTFFTRKQNWRQNILIRTASAWQGCRDSCMLQAHPVMFTAACSKALDGVAPSKVYWVL